MAVYIIENRELKEWLFIATRGLCGEASRRVSDEIEAHYTDAVMDYVAAGFKEQVAQRKAVSELGDPKQARRWYCHANLTQEKYTWYARFFGGEWCTPLHVPAAYFSIYSIVPMIEVVEKIWPWNMFIGMMLAVALYIVPLFYLLHVAVPKWVQQEKWSRVYRALVVSESLIFAWGAFSFYGLQLGSEVPAITMAISALLLTLALTNLINPLQYGLQDKKRFREFISYWTDGNSAPSDADKLHPSV
jgi:hypothetical protein